MMGAAKFLYYIIHYQELRSIIQWKTWHNPVHERNKEKEEPSLSICFEFLVKTSRSFSAVILELHPELLVPVALFYLILRGLDTIEDDMTIPLDQKVPLLRNFHEVITEEGWSFNGNGPSEKDRDLLVKFHYVVEEFRKVKPEYQQIIKDITQKMGNGMADYANNAEHNANGVNTIQDYDLYCHYVAGLVGNGLTRLFVQSGLANPALGSRPQLQESMGLFLQKTNIIRDVKEDFDDNRRFWPKDIWSKHVTNFEELFRPENIEIALNCSSEMVLNSLSHAEECIFYLAGLKEQSVFNFAAIPQSMAIATLELVFQNRDIFKRNVKITKGQACQIMVESTQNLEMVCGVFRRFVRKIHQKNTPRDPNFLDISIACAKVERFIESLFPSQVPKVFPQSQNSLVASKRAEGKVVRREGAKDTSNDALVLLHLLYGLANPYLVLTLLFVVATLFTLSCIMFFVAYLFGARFDIALNKLAPGRILQAAQEGRQGRQSVKQTSMHTKEL